MSDIKGKALSFGGINTRDLAPQVENLTLKGGDGKIDATFSAVDAAYASLVKYYVVTANTHMPQSPSDGVSVMVMPGTGTLSCVLSGLENGVVHHVRVFIRCTYGWQTSPMAYGVCTPLAGIAISTLAVGSEIKLNIGGVAYNHLIAQKGSPDATKYINADGVWLLIKDLYEDKQWHSSNVNDYANSTIHAYLNGDYLALLDSGVQNQIKQIKIPYRPGSGTSKTVNSADNGLSTKIFLLAGCETGYTDTNLLSDGIKLEYFILGNETAASNRRLAYLNGEIEDWLTRSPSNNQSTMIWYISKSGVGNRFGTCSIQRGTRACFVVPDNFMVNPNPNADGSYSPIAA
jgi:hypothetical protein